MRNKKTIEKCFWFPETRDDIYINSEFCEDRKCDGYDIKCKAYCFYKENKGGKK